MTSNRTRAKQESSQADLGQPARFRDKEDHRNAHLWMRGHYSFAELRDLVALLKEHPEGLPPMELNRTVYQRGLIHTHYGKKPSLTTLYHCRRALLNLGILRRQGGNLAIAGEDVLVAQLVDSLSRGPGLSPQERRIFAEAVLRNRDCRQNFFDLFMPDNGLYGPADFVTRGVPVIWQILPRGKKERVIFSHSGGETVGEITTEVGIQAILYGLRYWARNELCLIDELFREDIGNLMFPIQEPGTIPEDAVERAILSEVSPESEWTILSVRDVLYRWAVKLQIPIAQAFDTIIHMYHRHPDLVALVPTSRSLATLTTTSRFRAEFELRCYLRDERGRYISHVRLHRNLRFKGGSQWAAN